MGGHLIHKKRREQPSWVIVILLIISGNLFDIFSQSITYDTWEPLHFLFRELRLLGFSLFAYKVTPFRSIKLKVFSFMFAIWSAIIIIHNSLYLLPTCTISYVLYSVYFLWLCRIAFIPARKIENEEYIKTEIYNNHGLHYNVFIPVNTFRGMLQILFIPWKDPLFETRLLSTRNYIYSVQNKRYTRQKYDPKVIFDLIERAGAKIQLIGHVSERDINEVNNLLGKRVFTGVRDCRRLEL